VACAWQKRATQGLEVSEYFYDKRYDNFCVSAPLVLHQLCNLLLMFAGSLVKLGDFGIARTLNSQSSVAHTAVRQPVPCADVCAAFAVAGHMYMRSKTVSMQPSSANCTKRLGV